MVSGKARIAAKVLVTAILLWIVFRSADLGMVARLIARFDPVWAFPALLLIACIIVSDAILFAACLRMQRWHVPFGRALIYSVVGWFFSNLAPSTVGGDLFRGVQVSRQGAPFEHAVRAIVSMRLVSLATLFVVMLTGLPIVLGLMKVAHDAVLLGMVVVVAGGALAAVFAFSHVAVPARLLERWPVLRGFAAVAQDVRQLLAPDVRSVAIWSAGLAQHLLRVGVVAALATGLGLRIPLATLFGLVPAALLVAMVPISLGGWGMREAVFVYFLGAAGVSVEAALSLSVAFGFLRLGVGAMGGIVWALIGKHRYRIEARAD